MFCLSLAGLSFLHPSLPPPPWSPFCSTTYHTLYPSISFETIYLKDSIRRAALRRSKLQPPERTQNLVQFLRPCAERREYLLSLLLALSIKGSQEVNCYGDFEIWSLRPRGQGRNISLKLGHILARKLVQIRLKIVFRLKRRVSLS